VVSFVGRNRSTQRKPFRTTIKSLFLYFNLYLSVMLDSLSCSFMSISFITTYIVGDNKYNPLGRLIFSFVRMICLVSGMIYLLLESRKFKQWWSTMSPVSTNEQPPLVWNHLTQKKRPQHMELEIQFLAWDRHKNVAGLTG